MFFTGNLLIACLQSCWILGDWSVVHSVGVRCLISCFTLHMSYLVMFGRHSLCEVVNNSIFIICLKLLRLWCHQAASTVLWTVPILPCSNMHPGTVFLLHVCGPCAIFFPS